MNKKEAINKYIYLKQIISEKINDINLIKEEQLELIEEYKIRPEEFLDQEEI
jgi:hypothetical protein